MATSQPAQTQGRRRAGSSFIIATRNRHDHLREAVRSLVQQTVLPAELCIVDSSDDAPARDDIERMCAAAGLTIDYVHPAPRGLTVQRNLGVDRTSGDPVFMVDDDVRLEPEVHEEVLAEYERWGPELGGVRGTLLRPPPWGRLSRVWRRLFGLDGWWPEASGRMRAGFFHEAITASADVRRVESFNGWFMSFRRAVFELERFDEDLAGYAFKEDSDFSYRVAKRGFVLVQTPKARIDHLKTADQRLSPYELQRMNLANQIYLHRKNMPQTLKYRAALWWALLGLFGLNVGKAVQTRDRGWVTGMLAGAWEQARGRGPVVRPSPTERAAIEARANAGKS
jgi:GT2 family glycosyltransferase